MATKADIKDMATKADLQAAISDLKADMTRWMFGVALGQTAIIAALVKLL